MSGWRKKLLHFTLRAAQSLVIPLVLVLALCNFLKFTCILLCSVPENRLQAFVWCVGASDKCESEGGHRDSNGAHHAEGGHGSAVPCWHCHDRYWQDRWVTETKRVLCQYTVLALFRLGAVYIQDRLRVCVRVCVGGFSKLVLDCAVSQNITFYVKVEPLFTVPWYKFFLSLNSCKGLRSVISFQDFSDFNVKIIACLRQLNWGFSLCIRIFKLNAE